jgi:Peptidase A4 family
VQKLHWQPFSRVTVAAAAVLIVSFSTFAIAQREDAHAIFAAAPKINTGVAGVHAFPAPPSGMNLLTATNRELLTYGLPQRPNKATDAKGFEHWERAMSALQSCNQHAQQGRTTGGPSGDACHGSDVKAMPYSSRNAQTVPGVAGEAKANADGTSNVSFYNWSGIAQTNTLKSWNANTSFDEVVSIWNVPVANHPFGNIPCSDGPWWEVTWNGIDGFSNGDVVQGGSSSYWDGGGCSGAISYYGWVEWYPSYPILQIFCGSNPCAVGPGDDFEVITYGAPGTSEQFVFVEDVTQAWSGTFGLGYQTGPGLVGNSAEYIVERPCCNGSNENALGNYVWEFFDDSYAYDGKGTLFFPGNTGSKTYVIDMVADDGSTLISYPVFYGTSGNQGKYSFWMADSGCAYSGGCTP